MNALGLVEQESGRAVGFYCSECGRPQLPHSCNETPTVESITELHRKAEECCTTAVCSRHKYQLYNWLHCPRCIEEGLVSAVEQREPMRAPAGKAAQ